jgi:uncharacterized membrane protein YhhN
VWRKGGTKKMESDVYSGILALAAFLVVAAANALVERRQNNIGRYLTKPLLMPLLAIFYLLSTVKPSWLIVASLFFGFLGDVFLLWSKKQLLFMAGLVSFLIGHVCYIIVFGDNLRILSVVPVWFCSLLIPYVLYGILFYRTLSSNLHTLKVPIIVYMGVIIMMSFSSLLRVWAFNGMSFWLPVLGSFLFLISDSLLAFQTFKAGTKNWGEFIVVTYTLGQLLIVIGLI